MARVTKLELEQLLLASQRENEALRAEVSALRADVEMRDRLMVKALRDERGAQTTAAPRAQPEIGEVVSTYTRRDGSVWAKVRVGFNTFAHRPLKAVGARGLQHLRAPAARGGRGSRPG